MVDVQAAVVYALDTWAPLLLSCPAHRKDYDMVSDEQAPCEHLC